jgi:hypothetical protein
MSESTDQLRKAATAAAKDVKKFAEKHLPALRKTTRAVIETQLPKVADAVRKEIKNRRGR